MVTLTESSWLDPRDFQGKKGWKPEGGFSALPINPNWRLQAVTRYAVDTRSFFFWSTWIHGDWSSLIDIGLPSWCASPIRVVFAMMLTKVMHLNNIGPTTRWPTQWPVPNQKYITRPRTKKTILPGPRNTIREKWLTHAAPRHKTPWTFSLVRWSAFDTHIKFFA